MEFKLFSISKFGFFFPRYEIEHDGRPVFSVKRKGLLGRYVFIDTLGYEYMLIKRRPSLFRIQFELTVQGLHKAYIRQVRKKPFKNNYEIIGTDHEYYADSGFMMKSVTILEGKEEVAKISRKPLNKKDRYGIAMVADADEDLILAFSICIELIRKIKRARSAS